MGIIEDVTRAYIYSYNEAMKEYRNPNMAMNVAMGVSFAIASAVGNKQPRINPMDLIMAAVAKNMQEQTETEEEEDDET